MSARPPKGPQAGMAAPDEPDGVPIEPEGAPSPLDPDAPKSGPDSMDIKLIRRLVRLMNGGGIAELEVDDSKSGLRVRLRSGAPEGGSQPSPVVYHMSSGPGPAPGPGQPQPPAQGYSPTPGGPPAGGAPGAAGLAPITSPLVGTFYRGASPDSDPYAEVGSRVTADTIVCIVEAMKVMNEIRAEVTGEVVQILVENGEPVEYGQPLFLIQKGA